MNALILAASATIVAAAGSELVTRDAKLQTRLGRVLAVWAGSYLALMVTIVRHERLDMLALTIFWPGAFLLWFGVRSHLESSILLQMLVLLRARGMSDARLVDQYLSRCGPSVRLTELRRAGLVADGNPMHVTPKGKTILRVVSRLR